MEKDRVKGRIVGTAVKRRTSFNYAERMIPVLLEAKAALRDPEKETSLQKIADWLNANGHTSFGNGKFYGQTVHRLLYETGKNLREAAQVEHDISVERIKTKDMFDGDARLAAIAAKLADQIRESEEIDRVLLTIQRFA